MADVAIRGIPGELHLELKAAAERNHRSLNGEIVARLAASVRMAPVDAITLLERIQRRHRTLGPIELGEAALRGLREEGRSGLGREETPSTRWTGGE
ncbi:MAG: Arc family DNA-binding protein [Gemmatimonadetes bacterium]|nr:Arc family DNA-binding protein [Gemmatimonadota bacterium]